MVLQIDLRPFQKVMIYLMGISDIFFAICSRGLSKSFIAALGAICAFNLKPYSEVVITSSTIPQANKLVEKKMRDELIKKLSPYLKDMYEKGYIIITRVDDGYKVTNTLNQSTISVLPCLESSRGERATLLIYEECRLLKKNILNSVFDPMAHPRQAKYLSNPEYGKDSRWLEECKFIYITSAKYKFEWFWRTFKETVTSYYNDKKTVCNIFAGDIFMAINNGLKTWGDYRKAKRESEFDFRTETLNEMIGESEDAFFTIQSFKLNQEIFKSWVAPTTQDIYTFKNLGNPKKQENEVRLVVTDYAFANTTKRGQENDNTIILCMSLHWKGNHFERHVDYIEGHAGGDSLGAVDRAREIFWDYQADFYCPDLRNGGETLYNKITMEMTHPERGSFWNPQGLTISNEKELHIIPDHKLDDLRQRTIDPKALPCIIPVQGGGEINSTMWIELKKQLEMNTIKFLVDPKDYQELLEDSGEYYQMTSEQFAEAMLPYVQTDMLIQEALNLSAEYKEGRVKLSEPRNSTKDRAVCLSYANYVATKIENQWNRRAQVSDDNIDDINLVF